MGFLTSRDGGLSMFRIGLLLAVIGAVLVGGGFLLFSLEQAGRRQPLEVAIPAQTTLLATEVLSENSRRQYFRSELSAADVAAFYNEQLLSFTGSSANDVSRETCVREPRTGNYPNYLPDNGVIPYKYTCLFDSTAINVDQFTTILIHPDVVDAPAGDIEAATRIEYDQYWQP
jgi:hypothetical protein